jgi:outer membrane protein OmpA-like peptidoglycan-associated protein
MLRNLSSRRLGACRALVGLVTATLLGCGGSVAFEDKAPLVFTAPKPAEELEEAASSSTPEKVQVSERIQFAYNSSRLVGDSLSTLRTLVAKLKGNAALGKVQVEGHASDEGDDETNQLLSEARARAVRAYLMAQGIAGNRLVAKGFGEDQPLADNQTESGRQKNRRVEFTVLVGE